MTSTLAMGTLGLSVRARRDLADWSLAACPREACGLLLGHPRESHREVREAVPVPNVHPDARHRYRVDPADHLDVLGSARRKGLEIVGVWHSHVDSSARPSVTDIRRGWEGWSYVIVSTRGGAVEELRSWRPLGESRGWVEERIEP